MKHVSFYREKYPRPQFVRDSFLDLNGEWKFEFDDKNIGKKEKWFIQHTYSQTIVVPYSYQTPASGIGDATRHDVIWYEKEVDELTLRGSQLENDRVLIHFEGVDFQAELWVNGEYAGAHEGGYTRFSFDITDYLQEGNNRITLRVEDSFDTAQPRGKQRWLAESFACFYVETNGIWKSVWVETVSSRRIDTIKIVPEFDRDCALFSYELAGDCKGLSLRTNVTFGEIKIFSSEEKVNSQRISFSRNLVSDAHFFKVCYWTPYCPSLYEVCSELICAGEVIDRVRSYFGMRKIDCDGGQFTINNVPEYFKGILDQGYWADTHLTPPDGESLLKDIILTKQLGFNAIRKHQKIEDERFYYYCDVAGVYATCEMPSNYEFTRKGCEWFSREWMDVVHQLSNHPSVICWVPFNESWGVYQIYSNQRQQDFTRGITALTRALDGDKRPVISNDGWEHTDSDIIGLHNYAGSGEELSSMVEELDRVLNDQKVGNLLPRRSFANCAVYQEQPIIMSEYGGIAFECGEGWGYGKLAQNEEEFLSRVKELTEAIRGMKRLCGYCYTQLTDVQQEVNGLMTVDREYKADPKRLAEIFSK